MLEQIYSLNWIKKKPYFAFLLGIFYSIFGIVSARLVFGGNPGIMAVTLTALLILPSINKFLSFEEEVERNKNMSLKEIYLANRELIEVYFFLFLGILITFSFFTMMLPEQFTQYLFKSQLAPLKNTLGQATQNSRLWGYILNNLTVMFVCFFFSLFYGSGAVLMITWNASAWGVIFGHYAVTGAGTSNPFVYFLIMMLAVALHTIIEAGSYLIAAIGGGIISRATLKEKFGSNAFFNIMKDGIYLFIIAVILVIIGAWVEAKITPGLFETLKDFAINLGLITI